MYLLVILIRILMILQRVRDVKVNPIWKRYEENIRFRYHK